MYQQSMSKYLRLLCCCVLSSSTGTYLIIKKAVLCVSYHLLIWKVCRDNSSAFFNSGFVKTAKFHESNYMKLKNCVTTRKKSYERKISNGTCKEKTVKNGTCMYRSCNSEAEYSCYLTALLPITAVCPFFLAFHQRFFFFLL